MKKTGLILLIVLAVALSGCLETGLYGQNAQRTFNGNFDIKITEGEIESLGFPDMALTNENFLPAGKRIIISTRGDEEYFGPPIKCTVISQITLSEACSYNYYSAGEKTMEFSGGPKGESLDIKFEGVYSDEFARIMKENIGNVENFNVDGMECAFKDNSTASLHYQDLGCLNKNMLISLRFWSDSGESKKAELTKLASLCNQKYQLLNE